MTALLLSKLLVSVRDVAEAQAALAGGAALIDIKEPARGALGRADDATIRSIVETVAGRAAVSAALGEWVDGGALPDAALDYVKWGLAGGARHADWQQALRRLLRVQGRPRVVLAAYADWQCAQAPSVEDVFQLAAEQPDSVLLVDTCCKDRGGPGGRRPTLLDWLPPDCVIDLCERCRDAGVRIALAGSLGLAEIEVLRDAAPDWFAVRGAVCSGGDRGAAVQVEKVRQLVDALMPIRAN